MRIALFLILVALVCQLCGFNICVITDNEAAQTYWYNLFDSVAWTSFSLAMLRISHLLKDTNRNVTFVKQLKRLRLVIEFFTVLTVCPLVNDIAGKSVERFTTNFIYGVFALTYYSVKLHQIWKTGKKR